MSLVCWARLLPFVCWNKRTNERSKKQINNQTTKKKKKTHKKTALPLNQPQLVFTPVIHSPFPFNYTFSSTARTKQPPVYCPLQSNMSSDYSPSPPLQNPLKYTACETLSTVKKKKKSYRIMFVFEKCVWYCSYVFLTQDDRAWEREL